MKAAAKSYFGKSLADLTLAQDALLAAIPQSPTKFDLVRNAEEICLENVAEGEECTKFKLVVPQDSEVVIRRNHVLDLMKTRSTLTGSKHTPAEYEAAKSEPVELRQQISADWKAPAFRVAGPPRARPDAVPGRPRTTAPRSTPPARRSSPRSTWTMQRTAEKWVYVAARAPNSKDPSAILSSRKIPKADRSWILGLRGHNINNAAAAVTDYRTGEVLAYVGSASYTSKGNKKFQPQFDVLADGWRQPGLGHQADRLRDRHRRQDPDRLDDADGRHDELRWRVHPDPGRQARARARSASGRRSSSRSTSRPSRRRS